MTFLWVLYSQNVTALHSGHPEHLTGESSQFNVCEHCLLKPTKKWAEVVNRKHNKNVTENPKGSAIFMRLKGEKLNKGGSHISCLWNILPGLQLLLGLKFLTKFKKKYHSTLKGINSISKVFYVSKPQFWWHLVLQLYRKCNWWNNQREGSP